MAALLCAFGATCWFCYEKYVRASKSVHPRSAARRTLRSFEEEIVPPKVHAMPQLTADLRADLRRARINPNGDGGANGEKPSSPGEVVLTDISFPMPHTMNYEPDVLEACREMLCRVSPASTAEPLWVPCAFATESKIWEHYEEITRDFYVHVDAEE